MSLSLSQSYPLIDSSSMWLLLIRPLLDWWSHQMQSPRCLLPRCSTPQEYVSGQARSRIHSSFQYAYCYIMVLSAEHTSINTFIHSHSYVLIPRLSVCLSVCPVAPSLLLSLSPRCQFTRRAHSASLSPFFHSFPSFILLVVWPLSF